MTQAIEDLANSVKPGLADDCRGMENGIKEKCEIIKSQKLFIRKLLEPKITVNVATNTEPKKTRDFGTEMRSTFVNASTQADTKPTTIIKEVIREVEVRVPYEVIKEVVRTVEVPVFSEKIVEVVKYIEKPITVEVEKVTVVEKIIERPVEVIKIVEKPVI